MDQIQDKGDTASFTCQATGGPVPTISWYFNGILLADGATHRISETSVNITTINSTLTIMSVQSSDVGTYTCNATNVVSSNTSSGVLTVNGESIIKKEVCMHIKINIQDLHMLMLVTSHSFQSPSATGDLFGKCRGPQSPTVAIPSFHILFIRL